MPKVKTNGILMHYDVEGSGEPLICIMGITAPGGVWMPHVEAWKDHFRCIMPDNRGVGLSEKPEGPYTTAMMADDIAGLMDELQVESAQVVGCSMGSVIAQQLAIRHPAKVKSAILMCTWARCDAYAKGIFEHMKVLKARLTPSEFMHSIQLLIFTKTFWDNDDGYKAIVQGQHDAGLDQGPQPLHGLEAQAHACTSHDTFKDLSKIQVPCLVIGGKDDIFTPAWMAREVSAKLPNNEFYLFDNAGHGFHFEHIDAFNAKTKEWLLSHSRS